MLDGNAYMNIIRLLLRRKDKKCYNIAYSPLLTRACAISQSLSLIKHACRSPAGKTYGNGW